MTGTPRCLVVGAGRVAGGHVAPLLEAAGWETTLVSSEPRVLGAINEGGGLWIRTVGGESNDRWVGNVSAIERHGAELPKLPAETDFIATSVGPTALRDAGKTLAPALRHRLESTGRSVNVVAFENSRQCGQLLAAGIIEAEPVLARDIGRRIGIGGAAVWRAISKREVTPEGVRFDANDEEDCYVDAASLLSGLPPLDGSVPGLTPVGAFDDRMVEKLWVFNAGHAAAAYLGWHAGCETLDEALGRPEIRDAVAAVVGEAVEAFGVYLGSRPGSEPIPQRSPEEILSIYVDPALRDPVSRVGREPRRKLAHDDRLIGPAVAAMASGSEPVALAGAAAAALGYENPEDPQARDLSREVSLLGPEEAISTIGTLDPRDELTHLISSRFHEQSDGMVQR